MEAGGAEPSLKEAVEKRVSFDLGEEVEEEAEEEERELSYELFQPPPAEEKKFGSIVRDTFGFYKKRASEEENTEVAGACAQGVVHRYTLTNAKGIEVRLMTLGATLLSVRMPSNQRVMGDVLLGFDTLEDYLNAEKNALSFGSVLGRFSSLISNGQIKIGKQEYCLSTNIKGLHHSCGGFNGFDKALWDSYVAYDRVILTHVSPDGDEGYPGVLMAQISFHLSQNSRLIIQTTATTSKPTILSLGHNLFFNMAGQETGPDGLKEQTLLVNADRYVKTNEFTKAPDGELPEVGSSYFDLRVPRPIWKAMRKIPGGGYDTTFCLTKGYPTHSITFASRLMHPGSGRYVEILTDMPGLHINTGLSLPDPDAKPPLEPQTGFSEEHTYPQFCREEKKMKEGDEDLHDERQSWSRRDQAAISSPEVQNPLPPRGSDTGAAGGKPLQEGSAPTPKEALEEEEEEEEEAEEFDDKFLRDEARSDTEELKAPVWKPPEPIVGKNGALYRKNGAVCLTTEEFPDCMKFESFPKPILKPGDTFSRTTIYKFGVVPKRTDREKYFYL